MKNLIILISVILIITTICFSQKTVELDNIMKPDSIFIENKFVYVTEGAVINVYSLKDLKFIRKFGKLGEGPEEFKITSYGGTGLYLDILSDKILVSSVGKLSIFDLEGKFIKEMKAPFSFFGNRYLSIKNGFVGLGSTVSGRNNFIALDLYSPELKKIKEIKKWDSPFQPGKGTKVFETANVLDVIDKDKIISTSGKELTLDFYDNNGKKINSIKHEYKKAKVTEPLKKEVIKYFKTSPATKNVYQFIKPVKFPEYLPAVRSLIVKNNKIYIITFKTKNGKTELYTFDKNGKLLSETAIPLKLINPILFYPFDIWNNKIYQLIENDEEETWKLHINKITN